MAERRFRRYLTRGAIVALGCWFAWAVLFRPRAEAPTEALAPWIAAQLSRSEWRVTGPDGRRMSLYRHDAAWAGRFACEFRRDATPYTQAPRRSPFAPRDDDYHLCLIDLVVDGGATVPTVVKLIPRPEEMPPFALYAPDPAEAAALLARPPRAGP